MLETVYLKTCNMCYLLIESVFSLIDAGISIVGNRPSAIHSEQTQIDNRNNGSSYLTPALTNTVDPCLSDVTSLKREPSDSSEMASLLTERNNKNPFVNETVTSRKAEQTVV